MTQESEPLQDELTQSTQAQIEAAAKAIKHELDAVGGDVHGLALAALSAAAEVGWRDGKTGWKDGHLIADKIEQDTIERCAQYHDAKAKELEDWQGYGQNALAMLIHKQSAATLRAMKD